MKEKKEPESPEQELLDRRAKLIEQLKESTRFRQLLREAANQLRADAAKLTGEADEPRRRLLLESASRMDRYAADMEEDDAAQAARSGPKPAKPSGP
jgi:hypothetical protein